MKLATQLAIVAAVFIAALAWLCAVAPAGVRPDSAVRDYCEAVETNYVYDEQGNLRLTQLIFRDTDRIVGWKMPRPFPMPERIKSGWRFTFLDGDVLRVVECRTWYESFTQTDPEVDARSWFPQEYRRGLTPGRAK